MCQRNIHQDSLNPSMCPDWESNQRLSALQDDAQPTEAHQSGQRFPTSQSIDASQQDQFSQKGEGKEVENKFVFFFLMNLKMGRENEHCLQIRAGQDIRALTNEAQWIECWPAHQRVAG